MISVPYHLGRREVEVGRGPSRILATLDRKCHIVERANSLDGELDAVADVNLQLARAIRRHAGAPLILADNCNCCLGTLAGISEKNPTILWFDAHGDFNTPETTVSGALEGMSLAIATGACHAGLRERIGLTPIPESRVFLISTRSLDPEERRRLDRSEVRRADVSTLPQTLAGPVYLHLDLDVLDPDLSPGVNFSEPGGISPDVLYDAVRLIASRVPIAAAAIANFNPDRDRENRTLRIALRLVDILGDASVQ